ncbi:hypothetical protein [Acidihalobacter ferrooxydans]|uniref:Uncharacterized protein n=1 Tax=Acidihalobacter ferrooxydans TaxID=1765967 RepID=A0A1P8UFA4_9GAMM|nr:hypothetical protein [Acidihalobacter ferrooxydans]APZ42471.1 hypothetical protein BW247_04685 [Acidihalobacter ferrooxydans]
MTQRRIGSRRLARTAAAVVVTTLALSGGVAHAVEHTLPKDITSVPLASISNDRDKSISYLNLMLGPQYNVRGIFVRTKLDHHIVSTDVYPLHKIETKKGIVLGHGQGVEAILLRGKINSTDGYGSLIIKYINNGLFHTYKQCKIDLTRTAPTKWQLINAYNGDAVTHIAVKTWLLGISTLTHVCPTGGNNA